MSQHDYILTPNTQHDPYLSDSDNDSIPYDNYSNNNPVGDPLQPKPPTHTRLYFQNINGFTLDKDGGSWHQICDMITATQTDMFLMAELNEDTTQHYVHTALHTICRKHFPVYRLLTSSSPVKATTTYKPGGTAILAVGDTTSRIHTTIRDRLGRWSIIRLTGSHMNMAVISAYQVCRTSTKGTFTAYNQQHSTLLHESLAEPQRTTNPRTSFRNDLITQVRVLKGKWRSNHLVRRLQRRSRRGIPGHR